MTALTRPMPLGADGRPVHTDVWVPLRDAARLLDVDPGTLRRKCPAWAREGWAKQLRDPSTGHLTWHLHKAFDSRLDDATDLRLVGDAPAESPEARLQREPRERVDKAQSKALALRRFRQWRRGDVTITRDYPALRDELRDRFGVAPSLAQMYAWNDAAPETDHFAAIVVELLDTRGRTSGSAVSEQAWAHFEAMYLDWRQLSIRQCWKTTRELARDKGWSWPCLRRVQQLVTERIPPSRADFHRKSRDAWAKDHQAPIQQAPDAYAPGERWEADHTTCDCFVQVVENGTIIARRPYVTVWFDWRTRMVMGVCVRARAGDSDSVRAALLDALKRDDVSPPRIAWLDNGKDFASAQFTGRTKKQRRDDVESEWTGLLGRLGIEAHFALPYNHNGKARVERFFGVMHRDYERRLDSWCGSDAKQVDDKRIRKLLADPSKLPTLDEYRAGLLEWIEHYNHLADRAIDDLEGLAPIEMYAQRGEKRVLPDRRVLGLLEQAWERPMKVSKRGVGLRIAGRTIYFGDTAPELRALVKTGRRVFVTYDPDDLGAVRVYDESMRFLCIAQQNETPGGAGASKEDFKAAIAHRRRVERQVRESVDASALMMSDAQLARKKQRDREVAETKARIKKDTGELPAANLRIVRTGLEGEADRVDRAEQRRMAAGAEHDEMPSRRASRTVIADHLAQEALRDEHGAADRRPDIFDLIGDEDTL